MIPIFLIYCRNADQHKKNALIFKCYFLRSAHCTEQTPFTKLFPSGTHFTDESTEAMRINRLAQDILVQLTI